MTSPLLTSVATLRPVDLVSNEEWQLLHAQRKICGWGAEDMTNWKQEVSAGRRSMFWVCVPPPATSSEAPLPVGIPGSGLDNLPTSSRTIDGTSESEIVLAVGHIAMDKSDLPNYDVLEPDDSLTAEDGSRLTITSLFVLAEFREHRLGEWAMLAVEPLARTARWGSAACTTVTVNTMASRHVAGGMDGPEGMGIWDAIGLPIRSRSQVGFFERLGYRTYKQGWRYWARTLDGGTTRIFVDFMEKDISHR